jgi:hypothetical protein
MRDEEPRFGVPRFILATNTAAANAAAGLFSAARNCRGQAVGRRRSSLIFHPASFHAI